MLAVPVTAASTLNDTTSVTTITASAVAIAAASVLATPAPPITSAVTGPVSTTITTVQTVTVAAKYCTYAYEMLHSWHGKCYSHSPCEDESQGG